jgi:hypothetical protein
MTEGIWISGGMHILLQLLLTVDGAPSAIWVNGQMLPPSCAGAIRVSGTECSTIDAWDFGVPVCSDSCGERMLGGHGVVRGRIRSLRALTAFLLPVTDILRCSPHRLSSSLLLIFLLPTLRSL